MFEKHLWKSDIFTQNVTLSQVFFKHSARKNQVPGLSISGTLVENGLKVILTSWSFVMHKSNMSIFVAHNLNNCNRFSLFSASFIRSISLQLRDFHLVLFQKNEI